MKMQKMLGPCLGVCLLFAGAATQADDDSQEPTAAASLRVQIDPKTGKKIPAADDSDLAKTQAGTRAAAPGTQASAAANRQAAELASMSAKLGLPVDSQAPIRKADGSMVARVGLKDMQYMVVSIGPDGKRTVSHKKLDEAGLEPQAEAQDAGEQ